MIVSDSSLLQRAVDSGATHVDKESRQSSPRCLTSRSERLTESCPLRQAGKSGARGGWSLEFSDYLSSAAREMLNNLEAI